MKKGHTLIELLVVLLIFAFALPAMTQWIFSQIKIFNQTSARLRHFDEGLSVAEKIRQNIRNAKGILSSSNENALKINLQGEEIEYGYQKDKAYEKRPKSTIYLTDDCEVKGLSFFYPTPKSVILYLWTGEITLEVFSCARNE